jgi:hypothetical protein
LDARVSTPRHATAEHARLREDHAAWMRWGPYVAERAWGTVREDYSADGGAWGAVPHDAARSHAYRWNEDGLAGLCDDQQRLCLALGLWNEQDPILKERLFGLTGDEGNHGEDAKEHWWHTDAVPSAAWLRFTYAYPLTAFPYDDLVRTNAARGVHEPEHELLDTGVFDEHPEHGRDWADVTVDVAKADPDDLVVRIGVRNHSASRRRVHVLPTLWFRNTWAWQPGAPVPTLHAGPDTAGAVTGGGIGTDAPTVGVVAEHPTLGTRVLTAGPGTDGTVPELLFCDNETNLARLHGVPSTTAYPKDGINDHVVAGRATVNPARTGTKAAVHHVLDLAPGEEVFVVVRLADGPRDVGEAAQQLLALRRREADEFHASLLPAQATDDERLVHRSALAGLVWGKQWYHYDVERWLDGDPGQPTPPASRLGGRNRDWRHLNNADVISMPDSWEYPWYAAWDLAFHCVAFAAMDARFAKDQLLLMCREWYMHPDGRLPAYEWSFSDVNPPVHAWGVLRVFEIDREATGVPDYDFLARAAHKLLLNFTWWVNRKDAEGDNLFSGGFLGMDNIGPFDRSRDVPGGGELEQSDGTAWMAMFCLDMLEICLRLAEHDRAYEDLATKFLEHFAYIATAMASSHLWDDGDGFYYDVLRSESGRTRLRLRSMVGLVPLFASRQIPGDVLARVPAFRERGRWFVTNKPQYAQVILGEPGGSGFSPEKGVLLAIVRRSRFRRILQRVMDEAEFLAPTGVRSLSRAHEADPFVLELPGHGSTSVGYEAGESLTGLFGGNSNWRGPVWFPVNHLLTRALSAYDDGLGDKGSIEVTDPDGTTRRVRPQEAADEISDRLTSTFLRDATGRRPVIAPVWDRMPPQWQDRVPFFEYFHGDTGAGLGASHQTGWTALVAVDVAERVARRSRVEQARLRPD